MRFLLADAEAPPAAEQPRGDSLLEDELVDSPDAARPPSPWSPAGASGGFGPPESVAGGIAGQPVPEAAPHADDRTPSPEAVAFAEEKPNPQPEADAYLDDGYRPAATPAYFEDSAAHPLPASEISALPEAGAARTRPRLPPAPELPSGGVARGTGVRRPLSSRTPIPTGRSPLTTRTAKRPKRRVIWVLVGGVLGASVLTGGLAGFVVGAKGKPWSALWEVGSRLHWQGHRLRPLAPAADEVPTQTGRG